MIKPLDEYPEVLTAREIASYLGIGYAKSLNLIKKGDIPCIRIGNAYKVPRKAFCDWLLKPGFRKVL